MARNLPRIGLALGSGVARGFAHIGVLRALSARGVEADVVAGTSIGALVGAAHAAGKLDALEEWALSLARRKFWRYLDPRVAGGSLFSGQRLAAQLVQHLGDLDMADLSAPFFAVATDLASGHEVWLRDGPVVDAVRASYALPGIFPPVERQGRWLVDGALVNPVPISVCRAMEARIVVAVNLNADSFGRARVPPPAPDTESVIADIEEADDEERGDEERDREGDEPADEKSRRRWLGLRALGRTKGKQVVVPAPPKRETPGMLAVVASAFDIVQDRLTRSRLAGEPADVMIAPRLNAFGFMDFDRAAEMIELGAQAVDRAWPDLQEALDSLL
ncbi:patatin-like phospholipase family protein [Zavarzinia compransoris]|uniref:patatin-like phospholipase family protein n=1 Tax=Zavarzinia marina TaxID=2911065 RepID=UPI001F29B26C|nr:patatin-like phospholipase family protein [Zavarzinia marina]MCF4167429.1 patatin-like phospholipase family protein [Zavarzinia marina]